MIRNKVLLISCLFVVITILSSCSNTSEPLEIDYGWVAVQANYYEQGSSHIYLVNYSNPGKYKQITFGDNNYVEPKFSPDRQYILFGNKSGGDAHNPALMLYDVKLDTSIQLTYSGPVREYILTGTNIVWQPSGEIIYYYASSSWVLPDICFYNLSTRVIEALRQSYEEAEFVVDFIDANTMITWYSKHRDLGTEDNGYYLIDTDGKFLSRVTNPHLVYLVVDGLIKQGASNLRYNPGSELIVFAQRDSLLEGRHIAVTNLEGTYFKRYTTGYSDDNPCWGPGDNIVLFDRAELEDKGRKYTTVMKLNLDSGNVTEFVSPSTFDGAEALTHPNY